MPLSSRNRTDDTVEAPEEGHSTLYFGQDGSTSIKDDSGTVRRLGRPLLWTPKFKNDVPGLLYEDGDIATVEIGQAALFTPLLDPETGSVFLPPMKPEYAGQFCGGNMLWDKLGPLPGVIFIFPGPDDSIEGWPVGVEVAAFGSAIFWADGAGTWRSLLGLSASIAAIIPP